MVHNLPLAVPKHVEGVLCIEFVSNEGGQGVLPEAEEVADLVLGDEYG